MAKMDWEKANRDERVTPEPARAGTLTWWWTVLRRSSSCVECHEPIAAQVPFAYSHATQRALCQVCVENEGLAPAKSKRYRAWEAGL